MIKIENVEVFGLESAIRGMRNPMNSWNNSDSGYNDDTGEFEIGLADITLMESLVNAGTDHSKFMRMINVSLDITAPLYWWKEFDTYKVGTVRNSCSTMHKIHSKEFTLDDFSHEYIESIETQTFEDDTPYIFDDEDLLKAVIISLNILRTNYNITKNKRYWYKMIQLLPSSYNQRATIQLNYSVLRNMYHSRKNHKLDEWRDFCKWIESLPHSELITCDSKKKEGDI